MHRALLAWAITLGWCSFSAALADEAPQGAATATRQSRFAIPFSVPATTDAASRAAEIQLYASIDGGRTWKLASRQHPSAGKFDFHAPHDGQFWFASRTVDQRGHVRQTGTMRPELSVIVDTTYPQLDFVAAVGTSGEVRTSWQLSDEHLQVSTFRILYRHHPQDNWQAVAVDLPRGHHGQKTLRGQTSWWPQQSPATLDIRAEVRDTAGNTNVVSRRLKLPAAGSRSAAPAGSPAAPPQIANAPRRGPEMLAPPTDRQAGQVRQPHPAAMGPVNWPADNVAQSPVSSRELAAIPTDEARGLGGNQPFDAGSDSPDRRPDYMPRRTNSAADNINGLPPGERPRMTRHRNFNLDYDVEGVGPSGVSRVQLWATRDGGRSWQPWGEDADRRSPFAVAVDREGIYGFCIVVENGSGISSGAPRSGDPAEVWIGIDATPPRAEITSANFGGESQTGILNIAWQADDPHLAAQPVTLLYSDRPSGPWTTIAAGLPNSGHYDWRVDRRIPAQIFVRIDVRDEAGNIASHTLPRPVNNAVIPRGRIRGFHLDPQSASRRDAHRDTVTD